MRFEYSENVFSKQSLTRPLTITLLQKCSMATRPPHTFALPCTCRSAKNYSCFFICVDTTFSRFSVFKPSFYVMSMIKSHLKRITKHSSGFLCWILRVSHMSQLSNVFRSSFLRTPRLLEKRPYQTPNAKRRQESCCHHILAERWKDRKHQ